MGIIHGKDIKILSSSSTALIAYAKSCTIDRRCESIEVASATDQNNKHYIAGHSDQGLKLS